MLGSPDRTLLSSMALEVARFHREVTGQPMPETPRMLASARFRYRRDFLDEEIDEFCRATTIADQADALVDIAYVALGGLLEMGILPGPAFETVQRSNMLKEHGKTKRNGAHDAAKPEGWRPPDWESLLRLTLTDLEWARDHLHADYRPGDTVTVRGEERDISELTKLDGDTDLEAAPSIPGHPGWSQRRRPKILLLGYGRHGKDTAAEYLRDEYGFAFQSSSMFCAERVMLPWFNRQHEATKTMPGSKWPLYVTLEKCYADRHNHRSAWYQQIEAFNTPDKSSLGRAIFGEYDIYCGLRSAKEFWAVKAARLYDYCLWVDRSDHVPPEDRSSCTVEPWMADLVIDNNGSIEDLKLNLDRFMANLDWEARR